jgi:hypothetical protein
MKVVYLGYWSANDTLTQSVILPRLKVLAAFEKIQEIIFFSIERQPENAQVLSPFHDKIRHVPLQSKKSKNILLTKFNDFTEFPEQIIAILKKETVAIFIANSPLAGAIACRVIKSIETSLVVECFEPHADYMLESGVWKVWDPRYLILRYFENLQRRKATWLLTVSNHFSKRLVRENVAPQKILTVPNGVDSVAFRFDKKARQRIREELHIRPDAPVGIYVGKFGDIYYDDEAFDLFGKTAAYFNQKLTIIILTSHKHSNVIDRLKDVGVPSEHIHVASVSHEQVPAFLSAADFAWSTIRPAPCRLYCCPIKDGEYWANGLPVLLEDGIGDDSDIIKKEGGGVILDMKNPTPSFKALTILMAAGREELAHDISKLSRRHRNPKIVYEAYQLILSRVFDRNSNIR